MKPVLAPLFFCAALLSISACQQQSGETVREVPTDAAANEATADLAAPPPLADEPQVLASVSPEQLAGRFGLSSDVLDLKAAGSDEDKVFELKAGGRYVFTGGVVIHRVEGNWVLEENGTRLRVTPDQILPESGEMLFAVTSADSLLLLNLDGSPTNGSFGLVRLEH